MAETRVAGGGTLALEWSERAPADWEDWLPGAEGASFAARPGWLEAMEHLRPRPRVAVLTARRDGRLVGAVPASVVQRLGRQWVRSLPFGTYGGPLVSRDDPDPGSVRAALAEAFEAWLEAEQVAGGEVIHAPLADAGPYPEWASLAVSVTPGVAHVVDLRPGAQAVVDSLRRETKRGLAHAERADIQVEEAPGALWEVYALYRKQARRWQGHRPHRIEFLRALVEHPSGFARLYVATRRGELHAGILALSGGGETFLWWSGAAEKARRSLAYPFLVMEILGRAAAAGDTRVNLGSSGGRHHLERFKESLGATPLRLWVYHLRPRREDWVVHLMAKLRVARRRV